MKLLRLRINDREGFRCLRQGFEVFFLREWDYGELDEFNPYILAGPNGSGKSNILEAIAAIFYHIDCMHLRYRPEGFEYDQIENPDGFQAEVGKPDAFELEYLIPLAASLNYKKKSGVAHVKIVKIMGKAPEIIWLNRSNYDDSTTPLDKKDIKDLLPKYVLAYSSGENEILSLPFYKMRFIHFDEYRFYLSRDEIYDQAPEGRLIYLDDNYSQAILLSNFLLQPKNVLQPFKTVLGLNDIKEFRLLINKQHYERIHNELFFDLSEEDRADEFKTHRELTSKLKQTIEKFERCSTAKNTVYDEEGQEELLILDFFVDSNTKEAFRFYFNNSALELFQAFQILHTLNYYNIDQSIRSKIYTSKNIYLKQDMTSISLGENSIFRIKEFRLDKNGTESAIYTKSLSDGEHQFLHSLGLFLLFKDDPCLFLLDEPETHFNPDWRAKFISSLRECFEIGDANKVMREMLITTHSPFLISDSKPENVLLFNKISNRITITRPDFNTFGASVNKITMRAFGKLETIGSYAEQSLKNLEADFNNKKYTTEVALAKAEELGESVEKVLLLNRILSKRKDK